MSLSDKFLMFFIVLLFVLLPGCSAGRQSSIYREMTTETQVVRTDSLLLQDLFQASRNKTIDIEHIVFDTSRPDTLRPDSCRIATRAPVHSVTHITIDDQGKIETKTSVKSGSVSSSRLPAKRACCEFIFCQVGVCVSGNPASVGVSQTEVQIRKMNQRNSF